MLVLTTALAVLALLICTGAVPNELPTDDTLPTWSDLEGYYELRW